MTVDNDDTRALHDEVSALLPWRANGTLDSAQQAQVDAHIAHCDECRQELDWLQSLTGEISTQADTHYAQHADVARDFMQVMTRITGDAPVSDIRNTEYSAHSTPAQGDRRARVEDAPAGRLHRLARWIEAATLPQWAAVAAVVLVAILAVPVMMQQLAPENSYRVLSDPAVSDNTRRLAIGFADNRASIDENRQRIAELLADWPAQLQREPDAAGRLIVGLPDTVDVEQMSQLMRLLQGDAAVGSVELLP